MDRHIYLIGFMGTGKSTVSRELQKLLRAEEIEMDEWIVQESRMSIPEIFEKFGEENFRERETQMVKKIAAMEPAIVSCGGGAVLRGENVAQMKQSGIIVLLTATPQTVYERVRRNKNRPVLNGNMNVDYISQLMEKRRSCYEEACDVTVATDGKTPHQIADEILKFYNR